MKKILAVFCVIISIFTLSACVPMDSPDSAPPYPDAPIPETREELYSYYNQISRDTKRADVVALFGEGEERFSEDGELQSVLYINEKKTAGVYVEYTENDRIRSKVLFFNTKASLIPFSEEFSEERISDIEVNLSEQDAISAMGTSPLELSCEFSLSDPVGTTKILAWYNKNGKSFHMHTKDGFVSERFLYGN